LGKETIDDGVWVLSGGCVFSKPSRIHVNPATAPHGVLPRTFAALCVSDRGQNVEWEGFSELIKVLLLGFVADRSI